MAGVRQLATLAQAHGNAGVTLIETVSAPESYVIPPPVCAYPGAADGSDRSWIDNFTGRIEAHSPGISVYQLDGAAITPNAGIVTRSGIIVEESLYPYIRPSDVVDAFRPFFVHETGFPDDDLTFLTRNVTTVAGEVHFAREHGEMGYFHWLHSVLPRLLIARQRHSESRNLVALTERFQRESLDYLNLGPEHVIVSDGNTTVCERLVYCSPMVCPDLARSGGFFERSLLPSGLLRSLPTQPGGDRRVLISRRDAVIRRLIGEDEIASDLRKEGFETVTLTGMPFAEQVDLFASASIVVGSHGAGLANIAFMPAGSLVVELLAPDRLWPTYRGVAARSQLHYAPYVGNRAGTMSERDSDINVVASQFADFVRQCIRICPNHREQKPSLI